MGFFSYKKMALFLLFLHTYLGMTLIWKIAMDSSWYHLDSGTLDAVERYWANGSQGWYISDSFQRQPVYICFPAMEIVHHHTVYTIAQFYVDS